MREMKSTATGISAILWFVFASTACDTSKQSAGKRDSENFEDGGAKGTKTAPEDNNDGASGDGGDFNCASFDRDCSDDCR